MFKKLIFTSIILSSFSIQAGAKDDGLRARYTIEADNGAGVSHSIVDYFYQSGDFLAVVQSHESTVDEIVYLEKDSRRYALSPQTKTYIEVKDFEAGLSMFQPDTEGTFEPLKTKKKILGYKCDIHRKESKVGITNICVSPLLYKNWASFLAKIENKNDAISQVKGFPIEIVTLTEGQKKQTNMVLSLIRQKDYRKKFEKILDGYKKKETPDVQQSSTKMMNSMPTTAPKSQKELNDVEKMTEEATKKYK